MVEKILALLILLISIPAWTAIGPHHADALKKMGHSGCFGFTQDGVLEWYCETMPPTEADLISQMLPTAKAIRRIKVKIELRGKVLAIYTIEDLVFAALGLLTVAERDAMKAAIQPLIYNAKQAVIDIDALATVQLVEDFTW